MSYTSTSFLARAPNWAGKILCVRYYRQEYLSIKIPRCLTWFMFDGWSYGCFCADLASKSPTQKGICRSVLDGILDYFHVKSMYILATFDCIVLALDNPLKEGMKNIIPQGRNFPMRIGERICIWKMFTLALMLVITHKSPIAPRVPLPPKGHYTLVPHRFSLHQHVEAF